MTARLSPSWVPVDPSRGPGLAYASRQFHHAAQLATALGISYLPAAADDSHTNLGWDADLEGLASRAVTGGEPAGEGESGAASRHRPRIRVAVRPADLTLLILDGDTVQRRIGLHGLSADEGAAQVREALGAAGLDAARYTLRRHYEIPPLPGGPRASFNASDRSALAEVGRWYANAALALGDFRARYGGAEVRCWPHHFDIATLVSLGGERSSGAGLSPGDASYAEPYFYVNAWPRPGGTVTDPLDGHGQWHADGWFGAVLPASRLDAAPGAQAAQVRAFLDSAFAVCRRVAGG